MARIAMAKGAKTCEDALEVLEKTVVGKPLDGSVKAYWGAWIKRESWKRVYGENVH